MATELGICELVVSQVKVAYLRQDSDQNEQLLHVLRFGERVAVFQAELVATDQHGHCLADHFVQLVVVLEVQERRYL